MRSRGALLHRPAPLPDVDGQAVALPRTFASVCVAAALLLLALSFVPTAGSPLALWNAFYRSGALVFGGGHVVLPLLHDAVVSPGWVPEGRFVAGYGAAQALPGPLFAFAAYLGAVARPGGGVPGALVALVAIFLPGLLLVLGVLPFWGALRSLPTVRGAMAGANATVVGILAAALYDPVWTSAVERPLDVILAVLAFALLVAWRLPPLLVVAMCGMAGSALAV